MACVKILPGTWQEIEPDNLGNFPEKNSFCRMPERNYDVTSAKNYPDQREMHWVQVGLNLG